jgi:RNA polymerase sporulation-specific sigma factor
MLTKPVLSLTCMIIKNQAYAYEVSFIDHSRDHQKLLGGSHVLLKWKLVLKIYYLRMLYQIGLKGEELYYIGGSEALPPPLTRDEEVYLLEQLPKGDAAIRAVLIERNLRLVVYIARKFENTGINIEDLVSIGAIGLIKAVNTFDPEKKIKLATYASRCIENEILMYLRRNSKLRTEVSFDEPLNIDWDGNELLLSDVLGTDNDIIYRNIEEQVDRKLLKKALGKLSDRERLIMELRFGLQEGEEKTQKDVADMLGISQSYISRLEKRIIKRLRKEFNKMV